MCDIAKGRAEVCKDTVGGLDTIYFINHQIVSGDLTYGSTDNSDTLTAITNVDVLYKYELRGENSYDEEFKSDRNNGTTMVEQKLSVKLKKQDIATTKQVKLLVMGRPHVVIKTRNNVFMLAGLQYGMEIGATLSSGTAMGDFNGYALSLVGNEKINANILNASTEAAMLALFTSATMVSA